MFLLKDSKLLIEAPELLAHAVDIGRQRAKLVAVDDLDAWCEVTGRDAVELCLDFFDRGDQRPGDRIAERERERDAAEREGNDDVPRGFIGLVLASIPPTMSASALLTSWLVSRSRRSASGVACCRLRPPRLVGAAGAD